MRNFSSKLTAEFRITLGVLALLALVPLIMSDRYWLGVLIVSLYFVMLASGWNLLAGFTGQFSLAPAAFGMLGAYATALSWKYGEFAPVLGILVAILATGLLGFLLGKLVLRLQGPYLALTTLSFAEIARLLIFNSYAITNGDLGMRVPALVEGRIEIYYVFVVAVALVQLVLYLFLRSRAGFFLAAIRDDEIGARSRGVNTVLWKTIAFTLSSAICGFSGALYAHFAMLVTPELGLLLQTGIVVSMVVIGGMGSLVGPVLGGLLVYLTSEALRDLGGWHLVIFALLVIVFGRFLRSGLWGVFTRLRSTEGRSAHRTNEEKPMTGKGGA